MVGFTHKAQRRPQSAFRKRQCPLLLTSKEPQNLYIPRDVLPKHKAASLTPIANSVLVARYLGPTSQLASGLALACRKQDYVQDLTKARYEIIKRNVLNYIHPLLIIFIKQNKLLLRMCKSRLAVVKYCISTIY